MNVLVASSSPYRRTFYRETIESLGHRVFVADGGIECLHRLCASTPDVLVLETPLLWGGSDGVLEAAQNQPFFAALPVILVAAGSAADDWFQLSRFRVDDFLFRVPTASELRAALESVAGKTRDQAVTPAQPMHT